MRFCIRVLRRSAARQLVCWSLLFPAICFRVLAEKEGASEFVCTRTRRNNNTVSADPAKQGCWRRPRGPNALILKYLSTAKQCRVLLRVKVKVHTLDIAPLRSESPQQKALRYGTCSQGISQFYLHTHTFIRNRNEPYLPLPSQRQLVLIYRPRRDGRLSRPWLRVRSSPG